MDLLLSDDLRARLRSAVDLVVERLSSPDAVRSIAARADNVDLYVNEPPWADHSLAEGHPGVSMLLATAGCPDGTSLPAANAHLRAALPSLGRAAPESLYTGAPAVAFAAGVAARGPEEYATLLRQLDPVVAAATAALLEEEEERLAAGALLPWYRYDVVVGIAGLGRYLLARVETQRDTLERVLRYLVALTDPVIVSDHRLPGWWLESFPTREERWSLGHGNLGMAHGIAGPLALLSVAMAAGVTVPGQESAMWTIVDWLMWWRLEDADGFYWPGYVSFDEETGVAPPPGRGRAAWCYGTPGVARALQLAGQALGERRWVSAAVDAMRSVLDHPDTWLAFDPMLCHGLGGLLQVTVRVARDSRDPDLLRHVGPLAERILGFLAPELPFGFPCPYPPGSWEGRRGPDRPGFLVGAAGVALSLLSCLDDRPLLPRLPWDAALLLA